MKLIIPNRLINNTVEVLNITRQAFFDTTANPVWTREVYFKSGHFAECLAWYLPREYDHSIRSTLTTIFWNKYSGEISRLAYLSDAFGQNLITECTDEWFLEIEDFKTNDTMYSMRVDGHKYHVSRDVR